MEREQFNRLVARLDEFRHLHPRLYRMRVLGYALLGYTYLAVILCVLLALLAASILSLLYLKAAGVKLVLVIGGFVIVVVRGCWVEISAPAGLQVTRQSAPELFQHIEALRKKIGAPRFHRVLITDEFNAGVMQFPQLGILGWHANYLMLGMPLLKNVSPEQLDAILAHEFGHLAGGHARFGNWLYRLRRIWSQLLEELERTNSGGTLLFKRFFEWYVPRFHAYSFPLARANEYEADAVAVRVTSAAAMAEALTATAVVGQYLDRRFWPSVFARADELPHPSFAPHAALGQSSANDLKDEEVATWIREALAQSTDTTDTHPALCDRLRAFSETARYRPPQAGATADYLLGAARDPLIVELDQRWQNHVSEDWRRRHSEANEGRNRLRALSDAARAEPLSMEEGIERANLEDTYGSGRAAAIAQLTALVEKEPEHAAANYWLGVKLLAADDASGTAHVEKAMSLTDEALLPGALALRDFFQARGLVEQADAALDRAVKRHQTLQTDQAERQQIKLSDTLIGHGLDAETAGRLQTALTLRGVRKAWLARKPMTAFPERPLYLLAFSVKRWYWVADSLLARNVQRAIVEDVTLPGETYVICTDEAHYKFRRKLRRIPGTRLLPPGQPPAPATLHPPRASE